MKCAELYRILKEKGIDFFSGVPDSTFKDWIKFLGDMHGKGLTNIIACNECEATAIIAGHHLATGRIGVLYMQNAGLGKTVNPITSLTDPEVYSIPVLLMIGWRGRPGKKDEPQHRKMGRIMLPLLDVLEIPYALMPPDIKKAKEAVTRAVDSIKSNNAPYALIITNEVFETYEQKNETKQDYEMSREDAIKEIANTLDKKDIIVSTTGKTSRELFEYREAKKYGHQNDFLTVGSMGCAASIAHGIALEKPDRKVFIFDGDGAAIMQMGAWTTIGHYKSKNVFHIIFDNCAHDSTGGQPTVSNTVDFEQIALACGYKTAKTVVERKDLTKALKYLKSSGGPVMLVIKVKKGSRKDLGRPTISPIENKKSFMDFLK